MSKFAKYPSLEGSTVLVSGGASGIGAEIVTAFAEQKALVGFVDLDEEKGTTLAEKIGLEGGAGGPRGPCGRVLFAECGVWRT